MIDNISKNRYNYINKIVGKGEEYDYKSFGSTSE